MSEGLRATDISVSYGHGSQKTTALNGVSVTISPQQSLGLAGESGSGKSTLARVLVGLLAPERGTVTWNGRPLAELPRRGPDSRPRTVQLVFQDPAASLSQRMTVGQTLREALVVNDIPGDHRAEMLRLLGLVGLEARDADRYPFQFSGGQRQRIALARALAVRPAVLLCDEITSALDVSVQAGILNLLRDIRQETGLALAVVSHNLDVIRYLCDHVCVMRAGDVVEHGPTDEVLHAPADGYTRQLVEAVPRFAVPPGIHRPHVAEMPAAGGRASNGVSP
ncbi:ABC transporter ATP-binding protein [Paenarthrobacter sp. NPDC056912]|uniref:ABC transporter ATP-binding protein n=1 Tax=Paenarthrobacter sp. NPDC056912 TaxID=3345965 RepID=UPI0036735A02